MTGKHRVEDKSLLNLLHHIRYETPTQDMLDTLCADRTFSDTREIDDTIYNPLKIYPDALVLTMTRKGAAFINNSLVTHLFPKTPFALIVMENEQLVPVHI